MQNNTEEVTRGWRKLHSEELKHFTVHKILLRLSNQLLYDAMYM